ncbi:15255_t:CDS:2 [Racocetra fulgida]|uniref:15255_t:CDS:1 n=1 Tax=Racocetra fulgida TaxID=60492 RepID=A0A9N9AUY6_9GLOM|nr:15255_t:CDS:2 [Racocetra fulgida]
MYLVDKAIEINLATENKYEKFFDFSSFFASELYGPRLHELDIMNYDDEG